MIRALRAGMMTFAGCGMLALFFAADALCGAGPEVNGTLRRSGDAYVEQQGTQWTFGTAQARRKISLEKGHVALTSLKNLITGHELVEGRSDMFQFDADGQAVNGHSGSWTFERAHTEVLPQGELQFTLILRDGGLEISQNYIIYPQETIVQEWLTIKNTASRAVTLKDPFFLDVRLLQNEVSDLDFSYLTGGACFWGSWILKTRLLDPGYERTFKSTDVPECLPDQPCPKPWDTMGSSVYAPIYVFFDRKTRDGLFVGWDYLGRWISHVGKYDGNSVNVGLQVAGYRKALNPGESLETPRAFTGVYERDLDEMGNQLKDYQYRYKWDYTRAEYFPAVRLLGNWANGAADYSMSGFTVNAYKQPARDVDPTSTFRKVFRTADLLRYVGGDIYWRDYGWWDKSGDWHGPNFQETGRYLAKYGMRQTIYTIPYDAAQSSRVVTTHPEWAVDKGDQEFGGLYYLNQAKPEVTDFELGVLNQQVQKWGDHEWRKDDNPLHDVDGDSTPLLAQDQNFRKLVKTFLDQNPGSSFHGCNSGGEDLSYEALRMATIWQMSDGCVGRYRDYYASYLFPPDKLVNMPDGWDPDKYNRASWRPMLWSSISMTGDTADPAKLEGVRQLIDIYHYLARGGVVGRWVKVYHPRVTGDSPEWYLQRMSADNRRGVIIPSHSPETPATVYRGHDEFSSEQVRNPPEGGPVTVYPKGLLPDTTYHICFQDSNATANDAGSNLMSKGIVLAKPAAGELIYLNLPMHPGSAVDNTAPTTPQQVRKVVGTNMDYIGVELSWVPASDDNWISYYEIFRNGSAIDKVAKGVYYFDHSLGADPAARYEVQTVDGSGNRSAKAAAAGPKTTAALTVDDASAELHYTGGGWKHERGLPAVGNGTLSVTSQPGDSVGYEFRGNRVTWYGSLGASMGIADVYIDQRLDRVVDGYDADEIPNIAIYSRTFPAFGEHTLAIVARGERQWRSKGNNVTIDGIQVGREKTKIVEDAPEGGVTYSGADWKHTRGWQPASGGSISWAAKSGDAAECRFRGQRITWVSKLCPSCGMADVYADESLDAIVDTYAPDFNVFRPEYQGGWQTPVYERSWTAAGDHVIRIVVRDDKNMLSAGSVVYLDAFQVGGAD